MQYLGYIAFRGVEQLIRLLPFPLLFLLANFLAFLFHRVIRYRRKVVFGNLERSFPEKSPEEIKAIARDFYLHLADITLEGIKATTLSEKELRRRFRFLNPEILEPYFEKRQHIFVMPAHFGNWEWGVLSFPLWVQHTVVGVYKPIYHPHIGPYIDRRRSRFGLQLAPIYETRSTMENTPQEATLYIMMADQSPSNSRRAHWVDFLHQDTACLHGTGNWAQRNGYPVFYMDVQRVRRGFYEITFSLLTEEPEKLQPVQITALYMHRLESVIRQNPSDWLWSHRRWKRKRPPISEASA